MAFIITGWQAFDNKQLIHLMDIPCGHPAPDTLMTDAGYDSGTNRDELPFHGTRLVIKPNPICNKPISLDKELYKSRNRAERMINKLKQMRRVATRYDKTLRSFLGFVNLAAIRIWLPSFVRRTECSGSNA